MNQIHAIYTFDNEYETLINLSNDHNIDTIDTPINNNYNLVTNQDDNGNLQNYPMRPPYWRPSPKLQRLYDRFQNKILMQWPRIPCVYCGRLLYPQKACWIHYNPSTIYPLQQEIPNISLSFNPNI